jgi:hypothetical protein
MRVLCPRCAQPIPGQDIDLGARVAVCRPCGEVVPLVSPREASAAIVAPAGLAALHGAIEAYRPVDMKWVEDRGPDGAWWAVTAPPRTASIVALGVATGWTTLLVLWCVLLAAWHIPPEAIWPWIGLPVLVLGLAGGWSMYVALCGCINRLVLTLDGESFTLVRGPIPQARTVSEPAGNIVRFEAARVRGVLGSQQGRYAVQNPVLYGVHLLTRDHRLVPLRFGFAEEAHARFVAARLTQVLEDGRRRMVPYRQ